MCCFANAAAAPRACAVVCGEVLGHQAVMSGEQGFAEGQGECGMGVTYLRQIHPEGNISPQAVVEYLQSKHGR